MSRLLLKGNNIYTESGVIDGDKIFEADLDYIKEYAKSPITSVIITNMDKVKNHSAKVRLLKLKT